MKARYPAVLAFGSFMLLGGVCDPDPTIVWSFEGGSLQGWTATGTAFNTQPVFGHNVRMSRIRRSAADVTFRTTATQLGGDYWNGGESVGQVGDYWIGTYENRPSEADPWGRLQGDGPTGELTSPLFAFSARYLSFMIGGGCNQNTVGLRLEHLPSGSVTVLARYTGRCEERMRRVQVDSQTLGLTAENLAQTNFRLVLYDLSSASWGHINADDILITDGPPAASEPEPLRPLGLADLHAHPATHMAFGAVNGAGGIFWGRPGLDAAAADLASDLPPCAVDKHSGYTTDLVEHNTRQAVIKELDSITGYPHASEGWPSFEGWPHARSLIHQQMHVTWIRRAWQGGLRLMVASVTDSEVLAMLWHRKVLAGAPSPNPDFAFQSAVQQLGFIQSLAAANSWMQIVTTPAEARTAIANNRLAIVLAVEMDNLSLRQIEFLVDHMGVRLVTPIHLTDNSFGGAAVYSPAFNTANYYLHQRFFDVFNDDSVAFRFAPTQSRLVHDFSGAVQPVDVQVPAYQCLTPPCGGHENARGLASPQVLRRLMVEGVLIDIAHMSRRATEDAVNTAFAVSYPLVNSHGGLRPSTGTALSEREMERFYALFTRSLGLGTGGGNPTATPVGDWVRAYEDAAAMRQAQPVALGTDFNGFSEQLSASDEPIRYTGDLGSHPPILPLSVGNRSFDIVGDGLANYGMLPDFLQAVHQLDRDRRVTPSLLTSADELLRAWEDVPAAQQAACDAEMSGEVLQNHVEQIHGDNMFGNTFLATMGEACTACFERGRYVVTHTGNGSCVALGWASTAPADCRVVVAITNAPMFLRGTCVLEVFEH